MSNQSDVSCRSIFLSIHTNLRLTVKPAEETLSSLHRQRQRYRRSTIQRSHSFTTVCIKSYGKRICYRNCFQNTSLFASGISHQQLHICSILYIVVMNLRCFCINAIQFHLFNIIYHQMCYTCHVTQFDGKELATFHLTGYITCLIFEFQAKIWIVVVGFICIQIIQRVCISNRPT